MQLFICPEYTLSGNQLTIKNNPELLLQLRKVLRAKVGDQFFVQGKNAKERYLVSLQHWTENFFETQVLERIPAPPSSGITSMAIALPNKSDKLELILQKLTEIGIDEVFLRGAERSVVKTFNPKKLVRIQKIMQEAVEQSFGWKIPVLKYLSDISELNSSYQLVIFDFPFQELSPSIKNLTRTKNMPQLPLLGIVGPEGGLTQKDYQKFGKTFIVQSLGTTVLRMETATIIGAWKLKNLGLNE